MVWIWTTPPSTPRPAHVLVDPITDKEFVLEHSHLIHELVPGGSKLISRLIANGFTLEGSYWEQIEDASLVGEGKSRRMCSQQGMPWSWLLPHSLCFLVVMSRLLSTHCSAGNNSQEEILIMKGCQRSCNSSLCERLLLWAFLFIQVNLDAFVYLASVEGTFPTRDKHHLILQLIFSL